jgi:protein gp37
MGENSAIAWTHHTFNAWIGCFKVSEGCKNCYAAVDTFARRSRANGLDLWGKDAARHVTSEAYWKQLRKWNRQAVEANERRRVFCSSLSDIAEMHPEPAINTKLDAARARLFAEIEVCTQLDFLLLTKRPENLPAVLPARWLEEPPINVWLGTTTENQEQADIRIPRLLRVRAAIHFVSAEPLLGPIDLRPYLAKLDCRCCPRCGYRTNRAERACPNDGAELGGDVRIDWTIAGGESGPGARACDVNWIKSLVDQCADAGSACFVKQVGAKSVSSHGLQVVRGDDRKGGDPQHWPEDLRIREMPR